MHFLSTMILEHQLRKRKQEARLRRMGGREGRAGVGRISPEIGIVFPALTILVFMQYRAQSLRIAR